ncbi:MAG: c-type cytochrome [Bacteroidia bacterium]
MLARTTKLSLIFLLFAGSLLAQEPQITGDNQEATAITESNVESSQADAATGQIDGQLLFKKNCTQCHKLGSALIGPDLLGIRERKSEEWLIRFIQNSQAVIESGDEYAVALFEQYNNVIMPPQPLNEDEVAAVLDYIDEEEKKLAEGVPGTPGGSGGPGFDPTAGAEGLFGLSYEQTMGLLAVVLLILLAICFTLVRIHQQVSDLVWAKDHPGEIKPEKEIREGRIKYFVREFQERVNPTFAVISVIGIFVVGGAAFTWVQAQWLGSQYKYSPTQPIAFSHKLHAGQMNIDCQYCHSSASISKNAGIPSVETCMNCHSYVQGGLQTENPEIKKLIQHWQDSVPIEWVRIHNVPDLAYFNHSQHVTVGGLDCVKCHGQIVHMDEVIQNTTLEMGWCINCHRETAVDSTNQYYAETFKFMDQHKQFTIAQLGGLECSKCHY